MARMTVIVKARASGLGKTLLFLFIYFHQISPKAHFPTYHAIWPGNPPGKALAAIFLITKEAPFFQEVLLGCGA